MDNNKNNKGFSKLRKYAVLVLVIIAIMIPLLFLLAWLFRYNLLKGVAGILAMVWGILYIIVKLAEPPIR